MKNLDKLLIFLVFWPIIGAFISYGIGRINKRMRDYFANFVTILEFVVTLIMFLNIDPNNPYVANISWFTGFGIRFIMDGFRAVYALITALMWMMTTIFSREYFAHYHNRNRYYYFMLMTFGGTMGVFLSHDLITTFIFFEVMSFTSYVMVIHDESPAASRAADTYMAVAVIGGLMMLMGIFLTYHNLHTTQIDLLQAAVQATGVPTSLLYLAAAFLIFGFGGKAGMYPLHIWLPNAHPVAPAPASALLSGVLTKTGIYGIIAVSVGFFFHNETWGLIMLIIGVLGMFTGALLAVFSIDLKRTLACSSMSQIGFIMVGVGMQGILGEHNALAVLGTLLHMVNHSLIKLVLFMIAGVVYMNRHELNLNKIRGFGRGKIIFTFAFLMGVLGIIGMPMWNGYVSKTLLHESIVEKIWLYADYSWGSFFFQVVESIFTLTGGLTTAYMIKIFVAVCIEKNPYNQAELSKSNRKYMNFASTMAIFLSAIILPILGFNPDIMMAIGKLGQGFMHGHDPAHAVEFLAWINLRGAVASLAIGAIVYVIIVRGIMMEKDENGHKVYVNIWPSWIDIENKIYRPLLIKVLPFIGAVFARMVGSVVEVVSAVGFKFYKWLKLDYLLSVEKGSWGYQALESIKGFYTNKVVPFQEWFANSTNHLRNFYSNKVEPLQAESGVIWDGEGDVVSVMNTIALQSDDFVAKKESFEHMVQETTEGVSDFVHKGIKKDQEFDDLGRKEVKHNIFENKLWSPIVSSMAYGMLMFLLGFGVIFLVMLFT